MQRLHRRRRIGEHVRIGIGRRARHEAAVREQVGRAPQQLDAGLLLLVGEDVGDLVEARRALGEVLALRPHVGVVEAVEGHAEQREHLEGDVGLQLGQLHRVAEPGPLEGLAAERIAARPGEGVPVGDGEAQMILHALAERPSRRDCRSGRRADWSLSGPSYLIWLDVAEKAGAHRLETPLMAG